MLVSENKGPVGLGSGRDMAEEEGEVVMQLGNV